ncbi:MAG: ATP-binding protein, partial [Planctomycetota bacterium]
MAAFERVETIRRCLVSGQFNSREELTAVMQELPGLFDELRLSELVIHHSFVTATIAAELSLTKAEDEAIDRGLAASMLMGSETHFAQCLMRRAESLARYRPASFSATSIRSIMLAGVDAVNDRDLLRQAVEGLAFDADSESGLFAAGCLKRIESLNAIIGASANDFSIQNERHLEQIIDAQAEQILIREQAAKSASDRSAVFARIGLAMLCGLALILLRERWSLRKINVRLQEEIQCNERQRIERDRIELRLAQTERLESLGAIAGGIAHDFNNLLVGVLGNADLLRQEVSLSRSGENYLDGIVRSAETAAELSHKMLAYAGRQASTKRVLELNALLERMLPLFRAGLGNRHVIRFAPAEESLFTRADLAQIEQIVMNLVTNALQALGDRNGLIQITTGTCSFDQIPVDPMTIGNRKEGGHFVWFEVSDNGPGIPVSQQSRIFEPFYSTKPQTTGHGFGLSLVYGHVNRHHGLIHLVSSEGQGTTFRVLLPISEAEPGNESMKSAPVIPGKAMSPRSHVVIVDDQRSVVEVLQHALANAGLETTAFTSSTEALEFLADHPEVDMLLLDILMPELDGVTILQEMELKGLQIPVVVMSGFSPVTTEALSRFSAVKAVVPKPFRPEQILHLVVGMLESGRSGFEVALDSAAVVS